MDTGKPYLTLMEYADGHERDVAGHSEADGVAVWFDRERGQFRPTAQIIVSTSDTPPDGRVIIDVVTSDRRVNVKAWGHTVCPHDGGNPGNLWTMPGNYMEPLRRALDRDHPCTDLQTCDIANAREQGFLATAAWLLAGATETPTVDAVVDCLGLDGAALKEAEWEGWCAWHDAHHVTCQACNSVNYAAVPEDLYGALCGNCRATIHAAPEEDATEPE